MPPAKLPFGLFAAMAALGASLFYKAFFLQTFSLTRFPLNREGPSLHGLTEHGVRPLFRQLRSTQIAHSPLREVLTLPQRCLGRHGFREPVLRERTPGLLAYNIHGWLRNCGELKR